MKLNKQRKGSGYLLKEAKPCKFSYRLYGVPVKEFATESEADEYQRELEKERNVKNEKR